MASFPPQRSTDQDGAEPEWLGLGEASRTLGVNETTLRRWADAGLVQTFRTPGGHRRFAFADLRRIIDAAGDLSGDGRPPFDGEAVERIRARLREADTTSPGWLETLTPGVRAQFGRLGRSTVALVEQDLAGDADRAALESAAFALGGRYAALLRDAGVRLTEAVAAFAYFRRGMDEAVRADARSRGLTVAGAAGTLDRIAVLEDQLLLGLTAAYEREPAGRP